MHSTGTNHLPKICSKYKQHSKQNAIEKKSSFDVEICRIANTYNNTQNNTNS